MRERLQKIIASAGLASRRHAEAMIESGRILVNGRRAMLGDKADAEKDRIEVDGKLLPAAERKVYLLLNKPTGYVTTLRDPQGRPVVTDLVRHLPVRVFPVGRLDTNTEGLLLLTNDGCLAQKLAHPRHKVDKTYLVKVRGQLGEVARRQLESGIELEDGVTLPCRVLNLRHTDHNSWFEMILREGRNRQVRRMCEAVGFPVVRLKRIGLGFLSLGKLGPGKLRTLTPEEIRLLKSL